MSKGPSFVEAESPKSTIFKLSIDSFLFNYFYRQYSKSLLEKHILRLKVSVNDLL
jgi:hypothetical protein